MDKNGYPKVDSRAAGHEKYKMSILCCLKIRERHKNDGSMYRETRANLKELPVAKAGIIKQQNK